MGKNIVVFGSSISAGNWDEAGGWVARLKETINRKVLEEWRSYDCSLYNLSISGNTSTDIVLRFEKELEKRQWENEELFVILEIGVNDSMYLTAQKEFKVTKADFEKNVEDLIAKGRRFTNNLIFIGGPAVIDSLLNPIPWHPSGTYKTRYVAEFSDLLKNICEEEKVSFLDIFSDFGEGDLEKLMCPDGLHPSSQGHELIYKKVLGFLSEKGVI